MILLPVKVHLDGVIDDKVSWTNGVNLLWVATEFRHCIPHGGKVHHGWDTTARTVRQHTFRPHSDDQQIKETKATVDICHSYLNGIILKL